MSYRLLADENVELATVTYLRKLGHDVERIGDSADLDVGSSDDKIAAYARRTDRVGYESVPRRSQHGTAMNR